MERRTSALILVAALCTFGPSVLCGFVWDDHRLIVNNGELRDLTSAFELVSAPFWAVSDRTEELPAYYRPVVSLALLLQFQAFGLAPAGYHLVSVLLHLLCVALGIAWIRRRLPGRERLGLAAALGAGLFGLHPTRTEAVAWISGAPELWAAAFALAASLLARRGARLTAAGACVLAFFSKESAVVVPVLLATDAWLLRPAGQPRRAALRGAAWSGGAVLLALLARASLVPLVSGTGSGVPLAALPARALSSLGHYVSATLWPLSPTVLRGDLVYTPGGELVLTPGSLLLGAALILAVTVAGLLSRRAPEARPLFADALWFLLPLVPTSNLVPLRLDSLVAERYLYLPMLGASALAARLLLACLRARQRRAGTVATLAGIALVLSFAGISAARTTSFFDDRTLWTSEQAIHPNHPYVMERLVMIAQSKRAHELALRYAARGHAEAVERDDHNMAARLFMLTALTLLQATPDFEQEKLNQLRVFYDSIAQGKAVELQWPGGRLSADFDPTTRRRLVGDALFYRLPRALAHMRSLRLAEAAAQIEAVVTDLPRLSDGWTQLSAVRARQLRLDDAEQALARALALAPESPNVRAMRAALERARKVQGGAALEAGAASRRTAQVFILLGAPELARQTLDRALSSAPDDPQLIAMRARVDAEEGRIALARARVEQALQKLPEHGDFFRGAVLEIEALEARMAGTKSSHR